MKRFYILAEKEDSSEKAEASKSDTEEVADKLEDLTVKEKTDSTTESKPKEQSSSPEKSDDAER